MIVTELLGSMNDEAGRALVGRRHVERVVLADEDLSKRIQRVRTDHDREIGLRLPRGSADLGDGDILAVEGEEADGTTRFVIDADGERRTYRTAISSDKSGTRTVWVDSPDGTFALKEAPHVSLRSSAAASAGGGITSPMPGAVIAVQVAADQVVAVGDELVLLESMKMEIPVLSERSGRVAEVKVAPGDVVQEGDSLVVLSD